MAEVSDVKVDMEILHAGVVHGTGLCWSCVLLSGAPFHHTLLQESCMDKRSDCERRNDLTKDTKSSGFLVQQSMSYHP